MLFEELSDQLSSSNFLQPTLCASTTACIIIIVEPAPSWIHAANTHVDGLALLPSDTVSYTSYKYPYAYHQLTYTLSPASLVAAMYM